MPRVQPSGRANQASSGEGEQALGPTRLKLMTERPPMARKGRPRNRCTAQGSALPDLPSRRQRRGRAQPAWLIPTVQRALRSQQDARLHDWVEDEVVARTRTSRASDRGAKRFTDLTTLEPIPLDFGEANGDLTPST